MEAWISLRSVMSLASLIKCLTVVFIARFKKNFVGLHVHTIHIFYEFLLVRPFHHFLNIVLIVICVRFLFENQCYFENCSSNGIFIFQKYTEGNKTP